MKLPILNSGTAYSDKEPSRGAFPGLLPHIQINGREVKVEAVATSPAHAELVELSRQTQLPHSMTGSNLEERTFSVPDKTFEHLKIAQKTIWLVKSMLPYGAGNMACDIMASSGESNTRHLHTRLMRKIHEQGKISHAHDFIAAQSQGGELCRPRATGLWHFEPRSCPQRLPYISL